VNRLTGKITSFSRDRRRGVLASVGGIRLPFTHGEDADDQSLTEGQIVTYTGVDEGQPGETAAEVRAQY
jgi:cold shock CspA family protein